MKNVVGDFFGNLLAADVGGSSDAEEGVDTGGENVSENGQKCRIGHGYVILPLGDGLRRDSDEFCEFFLGEILVFSECGNVLTECVHDVPLFAVCNGVSLPCAYIIHDRWSVAHTS